LSFGVTEITLTETLGQKSTAMLFRRLLKNVKTGLYNDGRGGWTPGDAEAHAYATMAELIKAARELQSEDLVAVMKFPDSRMDVVTPLPLLKDLPPPAFPGTAAPAIIISLLPFAVEAASHLKHRLN
jgi:hypothetical protein